MACWLCSDCEVAWHAPTDCCWLCGGNRTVAVPAVYPEAIPLYYLTTAGQAKAA